MKKKTKLIVIITICLVLVAAIAIGAYLLTRKGKAVDCTSVDMLNAGYTSDSMSSSGVVKDSSSQSVYLTDGQKVSEVLVTEGQKVKAGDPLLKFDVTSLSLSVEMKQIEIESLKNQLSVEQKKLKELKNTTPIAEHKNTVVPEEPQVPDNTEVISDLSEATGSGTDADPYVFICGDSAYVSGSVLNQLRESQAVANFVTSADGMAPITVTVNGQYLTEDYDDSSSYRVFWGDDSSDSDDNSTDVPDTDDTDDGYTAQELAKAIEEQEKQVKETDLQERIAEVSLKDLQAQLEDGTIYAKNDGTVTTVMDIDNPPQDGSPALVVSGAGGLTVEGCVGELDLENISVGQSISASDWESGNMYTGTITAIDTVPTNNNSYYGEGNPNVSYYAYTAVLDDTTDLKEGTYLDLTIETDVSDEDMSAIFIDKSYVRTEKGQSYVYKAEDGRLVKQNVKTGKVLWGSYVEIKSGITTEDYLAFPYGVNEGDKANIDADSDSDSGVYY